MQAAQQMIVDFLTSAGNRLVIPVYQRPYSWDEEQCEQLWDDILNVGKHPDTKHFTGSVVWVQDGLMSPTGITPILIIDGQQRVTTIVLLTIALARYARSHPEADLSFSAEEILGSGYLTNPFKKGADHYKLTLSQGDKEALCSIVDNLEDPDAPVSGTSERILNNLQFFEKRLSLLEDPNIVWNGIQRLEIVSISLDQGKDNPQLIFESMNSTGKELSSADLIRNFVLMPLGREEQESLYEHHWRAIEATLGVDSYDSVFDDFIRNYLTVLYAPESLARREVYPAFKRHVVNNGYDEGDRIVELLKELERFASYYACITSGAETNQKLKRILDRVASLDISAVNPLLMSFYDDFEKKAFDVDDFEAMLCIVESYIMRRAVCDCASSSLVKFFASIIYRLNKIQDENGNYREAFTAYLLNEANTARRFPSDTEFRQNLKNRDCYHFKKAFSLLATLENSSHQKGPIDFGSGVFTIEHIMPQNALAHEEWREMLGDDCEGVFEKYLNSLGNLTLTAFNSELSDASFEQKKHRIVGGFDKSYLTISADLRDAEQWTAEEMEKRAERLTRLAVRTWPMPQLDDEVTAKYLAEKRKGLTRGRSRGLKDLFSAGFVSAGDTLVSSSPTFKGTATITELGTVRLQNGEEFKSPSMAAIRTVSLQGGSGSRNGWNFWRLGESGPLLNEIRTDYLKSLDEGVITDMKEFRLVFWDRFFDYCSELPEFVASFGDTSEKVAQESCWVSFRSGIKGCTLTSKMFPDQALVVAEAHFHDLILYGRALQRRSEIDSALEPLGGSIHWDDADEDKKSRNLQVSLNVDFDSVDLDDVFRWYVDCFWKLKTALEELSR